MEVLALLLGCGGAPEPGAPSALYQPDEALPSSSCPEETGLAAYAFFCDAQGGISGCLQGTEPGMCDQATSTRHDCDCDTLSTCSTYAGPGGGAVVGCLTATQRSAL